MFTEAIPEYTIPKSEDVTQETKPSWQPHPFIENAIRFRCDCAEIATIHVGTGGSHKVSEKGVVHPSIHHPVVLGGCGWHVWGTLDGWPTSA